MADWAVRVEGLSKRFTVGRRTRPLSLRQSIARWATAPGFWLYDQITRRPSDRPESAETLWAVQDVSFEIKQGEVVGILGRNGAGKSTLLKVLARILEPERGRALLRGQVGALLEVGTGFHPELTGRENIFLSGALLGMRRAEMVRKFDEIVAFAETERFLDTPVKHYSSGLYMRLAFAVAAHLQPDVLIVDEVLAVGDAAFQKKCLTAMEQVGNQGRTVLFVSHNMPAVTRLCPRALLLEKGQVVADGPTEEVIHVYLRGSTGSTAERVWTRQAAPGDEFVRLRAVRVRDHESRIAGRLDIREPFAIEIHYEVLQTGRILAPSVSLHNETGVCLFVSYDTTPGVQETPRSPGEYISTAVVPGNLLAEGTVIVKAAVTSLRPIHVHVSESEAVAFEVVDSLEGGSARGHYGGIIPGAVRPLLVWRTATAHGQAAA